MANLVAWKQLALVVDTKTDCAKLETVHYLVDRVLGEDEFGFSENIDLALPFSESDAKAVMKSLEKSLAYVEEEPIEVYLIDTIQPVRFRLGISHYHEAARDSNGLVRTKAPRSRPAVEKPLPEPPSPSVRPVQRPLEARVEPIDPPDPPEDRRIDDEPEFDPE